MASLRLMPHLVALLFFAGAGGMAGARESSSPSLAPEAVRAVVIPRAQPIRIRRAFIERTPDAAAPPQGHLQPGGSVLGQMAVIALIQVLANVVDRNAQKSREELVVSIEQTAGPLAAVSELSTQKRFETQEDINQAIRPYGEALAGTVLVDLLRPVEGELARGRLRLASDPTGEASSLYVDPVFVFASDQRSVHIDALIGLGDPVIGEDAMAAAITSGRAVRVQVHSKADNSLDIGEFWLKDRGTALRTTFAELLVAALETAARRLDQGAPRANDGQQRTWRFRLGSESVFIRGAFVEASCDHVLIDSVRGLLVRMPAVAFREKDRLPAHCAAG
jgi:hypothetical protein